MSTNVSLKEQIGQMVVVRASGYLFDGQRRYPQWEAPAEKLQYWLQQLNVGGVILLGGSAAEISLRSQQLQSQAKTPLLIAADIEEGVGQRFEGATWFPPPMAIGAIAKKNFSEAREYARQFGAITAKEALAMGINWILAPIVDVNNNPDNPVINIRAFSDSPEIVGDLATAFISGAQAYPILTTAKHFPGHGDTATDSHLHLPTIAHGEERLAAIELPPFQRAIAAKVDSVMTAHVTIPVWDKERPATLSPAILTEKLRQQLGFTGLIVTDALIMGGVANYTNPEEVAVMAIEAGADILLMPVDPEKAIAAVYRAVESGRLTEARIAQSVARITRAKQKLNAPSIDLTQISQLQARKTADEILQLSMQSGGKLPLSGENSEHRCLIVVDDAFNRDYLDKHAPAVTIPQKLGYQVQLVDGNTLNFALSDAEPTLLQVFLRGNPFRGTAGLTPKSQGFYRQLLASGTVKGLIIYGSPYVLEWFRPLLAENLPWVFSFGQMARAQALALGTLYELSGFDDLNSLTFL